MEECIDRTKANEAGEFVMMPPTFAQGSYELTLRTPDAGSKQAVTVAVPEPGKGEVLVVVGEAGQTFPDRAGRVAGDAYCDRGFAGYSEPCHRTPPAAPQTAEASPELPLRIGAVEAEGGKLFVQGTGPDGARAQIYLNDSPLAEAMVGDDGKWSLKIEKGVAAGNYKVRVDQLGESGTVVARAEVPFASLKTTTLADAPKPSELASSSTNPADAPSTTAAVRIGQSDRHEARYARRSSAATISGASAGKSMARAFVIRRFTKRIRTRFAIRTGSIRARYS